MLSKKIVRLSISALTKLFILFVICLPVVSDAQYVFTQSQVFSVKVNGQTVYTEFYKTVPDELNSNGTAIRWPLENVSICHFNFTGIVTVEVTCSKPFTSYNLSPKRFGISHTRTGDKITFTIDKPGKFNINMNNDSVVNEQLFIFADLLENKPDLSSPSVKNIMNLGGNNSGTVDNTTAIQNAINGLTAGQTLFFPQGQYLCKTIRLKSNMTMYLEAGAILLGTKNYNDYVTAGGFVIIDNCTNTSIRGYGRINQRGEQMQANYGSNAYSRNILVTNNSVNTILEDIFSLDPPRINIEVSADNTSVLNAKVMATQAGANTDGIDPWNCKNTLYDNTFIYGRDDAVAIKSFTSVNTKNTTDFVMSNSIVSSLESCFKVGTETERDSIRNITFENCDAIYAGNAMSIWSYDKAKINNVYFRNIGVDRLKPSFFTNQGNHFYMEVFKRSNTAPGSIVNVVAEKIKCESRPLVNKNYLTGLNATSKIDQLNFKDYTVADTLVTNANKLSYFDIVKRVSNLTFGTTTYSLVSIASSQNQITEGQTGSFIITRTGPFSSTARVNYFIRGNAKNGTDFTQILSYVIFNPGETQKIVSIASIADNINEQIEQVCLSLKANTDRSYMLGTNFISVINIKDASYTGSNIIISDPVVSGGSMLKTQTQKNPVKSNKQVLNVYPNPSSGMFIIESNEKPGTIIYIVDAEGKIVLNKKITSNKTEINTSLLAKGTYFIKVNNDSKKIIIQ